MTKQQYFEMCEQLQTTPVPSEIPVELSDLPLEIQTALTIWFSLPDNIDTFNSGYYGKHLTGITEVFRIYNVDPKDWKFMYLIIQRINSIKVERYNKKKSAKPKKASS